MGLERIGIIGVGEIGGAITEGLCEGVQDAPQVFLSPRGARIGAALAERFPTVQVCTDNQEVADRGADLLLLAVRPQDREDVLAGLQIQEGQVVVSALAGVGIEELRQLLRLDADAPVVRSIPFPTARERRSLTVTCPSHPTANALFERLGSALPVSDEDVLSVFSALSAAMSSHFHYLMTLTAWAANQGIPSDDAERYLRELFQGIARTLGAGRPLTELTLAHETPGGTNERIRTTWFDPNSTALTKAFDALLADLKR